MNWSDYEAAWKRQELPVGETADIAELKRNFETQRRKFLGGLWLRDMMEAAAGVVVAISCGRIWWKEGRDGWPIGFAILLVLFVTAIFVRERMLARRRRLGADATLLTKLDSNILELERQRRLLTKVWAWYLGPIALSLVIVRWTVTRNRPTWDPVRDPRFIVVSTLICVALFAWVWWMNTRAVKTRIDPRLAELRKLRRGLSSSEDFPV